MRTRLQRLTLSALVAALYLLLGLSFAPLSFGPVQCRLAEALCLLPLLMPEAAMGLGVGCLLTNLVGLATGANLLGPLDLLLGTGATLAAALLTAHWRERPLLAALPPVLLNALVVGGELAFAASGTLSPSLWASAAAYVALGQAGACWGLGPLVNFAAKRALRALPPER